jgi:hypothetical protein
MSNRLVERLAIVRTNGVAVVTVMGFLADPLNSLLTFAGALNLFTANALAERQPVQVVIVVNGQKIDTIIERCDDVKCCGAPSTSFSNKATMFLSQSNKIA